VSATITHLGALHENSVAAVNVSKRSTTRFASSMVTGKWPGFPEAEMLSPTPELLSELSSKSADLESETPEEILRWAIDRFGPRFTMATAFGPEGMCILHMLSVIAPDTYIFNLDTGYQFKETLELRERVAERYGMQIDMRQPAVSVAEYEQMHGGPVYTANPNQCCADRKVKVLEQTVKGFHAWASAIRRDQSSDRSVSPIVGWDKKFGLVKVSPLANWTKKDVWKMITDNSIPYNPLHDQGYPSIGCWPCTRAVLFGEDERSGRWSGTAKTECGLHSLDEPKPPAVAGGL
jgi:phosphoadenosine phosphosulfate reductase